MMLSASKFSLLIGCVTNLFVIRTIKPCQIRQLHLDKLANLLLDEP